MDIALRRWLGAYGVAETHWGVLRLGDRGDDAGNDHEFLASVGGFSVDRISWAPSKCFPAKTVVLSDSSGPTLTAQLLKQLTIQDEGFASFAF